tara:strand:- start:19292 stop:19969 length:678 start_codon:yes stop_codon:yes gene_type:complete
MKNLLYIIIAFSCFLNCLSAPDFERDNIFDLSSGTPYIRDARYLINMNGLNLNWVDGSIENDAFIITQKLYDQSDSNSDSLIKTTEIEGDSDSFVENSGEYGFPHTVIITSVIYENNKRIKGEYSDTLDIKFGSLSFRSQVKSSDSLIVNWQTIPDPFTSEGILVELNEGNGWQEVEILPYFSQSFKYGLNLLEFGDKFRFSLTIINYNGKLSSVSSFELEPDLD